MDVADRRISLGEWNTLGAGSPHRGGCRAGVPDRHRRPRPRRPPAAARHRDLRRRLVEVSQSGAPSEQAAMAATGKKTSMPSTKSQTVWAPGRWAETSRQSSIREPSRRVTLTWRPSSECMLCSASMLISSTLLGRCSDSEQSRRRSESLRLGSALTRLMPVGTRPVSQVGTLVGSLGSLELRPSAPRGEGAVATPNSLRRPHRSHGTRPRRCPSRGSTPSVTPGVTTEGVRGLDAP